MTNTDENMKTITEQSLTQPQRRAGMPKSERTRQEIIDAAGPLFAEKGYKSTTVADICKAAHVNQAAVSFHFGGKEQLYLALVRHAYEFALSEVPLPQWAHGTPANQKLRDFVLAFLRRCVADREPRWPCQLLMREVIEPSGAAEELVREFVRPNFELLRSVLLELLPADCSEEQLRLVAGSIIGQCLHCRVPRHVIRLLEHYAGQYDEEHLRQLADHIARFSLAALGHAAPLTADRSTGKED